MMKQNQIEEVVKEALSDYLAGAGLDKIKRALSRLSREKEIGDEDIVSQTSEPPGDPPDEDDETPEEKQRRKRIEGVFQALSITGGSAADFRKMVNREVKKVFDNAARQFAKSQSLKQVYDAVEKAVTTNLEKAVTQSLQPEIYTDLRESMVSEISHQIKEVCGDFGPRKKVTIRIKK